MLLDTGPLLYILWVALLNLYIGFAVARVVRGKRAGLPGFPVWLRGPNSSGHAGTTEAAPGGLAAGSEPPTVAPEEVEKAMVAAMEQFRLAMAEHNDELSGVDWRLQGPETPVETIRQCAEELKDAGERYLGHRDRLLEEIEQYEGDSEAAGEASRDVQIAVETRAAAVYDTISKIDGLRLSEETAEDDSRQLQAETKTLVETCQEIQGTIDGAIDKIVQGVPETHGEQSPKDGGENAEEDTEAKLGDRDEMASRIEAWCSNEAEDRETLCLGIIDVDQFDEFTSEFEPLASDRIVLALARLALGEIEPGVSISRYGGNQFLLAFSEIDPQQATVQVERIRQQIDKTVIKHSSGPLHATVSCAVVEGQPGDSYTAMLDRALATLQEAQRYGHNRTFLYEGDCPAPVVPPDLDVQKKTISV